MKSPITLRLYNLTLLLIPIIIVCTILFDRSHDLIYMPIATVVISFILFSNFPKFVLMFHQRPLYYDDLIIKDFSDEDMNEIYDDGFRKRYQRIFKWVVTVTSALMIGVLTDIWYMRDDFVQDSSTRQNNGNDNSFIDPKTAAAMAIIISLSTGYLKVSVLFGKFLIKILKFFKKREIEKERQRIQRRTQIELMSSQVTIDANFNRQLLSEDSLNKTRSHNDLTILGLQPNVIMESRMNEIFA